VLDIRRREATSTKKKLANFVIGLASTIIFVAFLLLISAMSDALGLDRYRLGAAMSRDVASLLEITVFKLVSGSVITMVVSGCVIILAQRIK